MTKKYYNSQIEKVERIASASRFQKLLMRPFQYIYAILYRELIYKKTKREKEVLSNTFFNFKMHLLLPSSTDIYLTGGKSHPSEIRLAKFLINHLNANAKFVDVGAHYGYFSLLASGLIGPSGKVYSFEASPKTYNILHKNKERCNNISCYNLAVSDEDTGLTFYEFPNLYSEYNSLDIGQFKNEDWFSENQPNEVNVKGIILDDFLVNENVHPHIIKIDVEGAEFKVINGLKRYLLKNSPIIVMEFLAYERDNKQHIKAADLLQSSGYSPHVIEKTGEPAEVKSVPDYIQNCGLESDNIVFMKIENGL